MNYISEIRAFRNLAKRNSLDASEIALWYAFIGINNDFGWPKEFPVPIKMLEFESGLSRSAVYRARNKLKQIGAIDWRERPGKACSTYTVNSLVCHIGTQGGTQSEHYAEHNVEHYAEHNVGPLYKQNKNKTKTYTPLPPKGEDVDYRGVVDLFHRSCPTMPKVRDITDGRKRAIKARFNSGNTLEDFEAVFKAAGNSDFLTGKNGAWNGCSFDWLLKPANWQKVKEGNYDDKPSAGKYDDFDWDEF